MENFLAHGFFIQHAQHGIFAVDGGHDGDAEIDQPILIAHAEAAVLGHAALGDIELAHDLDTRNDGRVPVFRKRLHRILQHAVDAVLDGHFLVARFDVNVAGAPLERVEDGGVHQLDHRRDIGIAGREAVDRKRFVGVVFVADHVQRKALGDFLENALGLLGLFKKVGNLRERGHAHAQLLAEQHRQLVDQVQISRIGDGDFECSVLRLNRHKVVAEHQIDRDGVEQVVVDAGFFEVHKLVVIAGRQGARLGDFLRRILRNDLVGGRHEES